jgi:hypothetical protein
MSKILEAGRYEFRITRCDVDHISNAGNKSIKLGLAIEHDGEAHFCWEYLTKKLDPATGKPYEFIEKRLNSLLLVIGKPELIGKELTNQDLLSSTGFVVLKKETSPVYGESNKVERFVPEKKSAEVQQSANEDPCCLPF